MRFNRLLLFAAIVSLSVTSGFAAISPAAADWAKGPVQFLMTNEELTQWNALQNDADANAFIALFWARRDPTPGTPANEFREDYQRRVAYADQNFTVGKTRGALSDRGKALIVFGPPTHVMRSGGGGNPLASPTTPGATFGGRSTDTEAEDTAALERQMWTYEGAAAQKAFGAPKAELRFVDRLNNHDLKLETPRLDYAGAQQRAIVAAITQPNLTSIPQQPTAVVTTTAPAAPAAPVSTNLKTPAFEAAIADAKAGKVAAKGAAITYVEFVSPSGDYYAPVALYVPASTGVTPDGADTFFGIVEDAAGKRVAVFEEPAKLTPSKTDLYYDRTLILPSGKYTATFGLAKAGTPVVVASAPLELNALGKDSTGTSRLVVSDDVYELPEAAPVKTPFAFGKLKIVPKGNLTFTNKDELQYFVEVHNPGLADVAPPEGMAPAPASQASGSQPATVPLPKIQTRIEILDAKGAALAGAPLAETPAMPLSGRAGPGQYAIMGSIPLAKLKTPLPKGSYTLRMKIVDTVTKQSYTVDQPFKITG
jgi:GWxTD domain-containing protein